MFIVSCTLLLNEYFTDGKPLATRRCLGDQSFGAYWHDDIIYRSEVCPQPPQSEVTVALKELAQVMFYFHIVQFL